MTLETFAVEYNNLKIEKVYINSHTLESVKKRFNIDLKISDLKSDISLSIAFQKYKKNFTVNDFKFVIFINDIVLVLNIYEKNNKFYGKVLTALSQKQFELSKNFYLGSIFGNFECTIKEYAYEEVYFNNSFENIKKSLNDYKQLPISLDIATSDSDIKRLRKANRTVDVPYIKGYFIKVVDGIDYLIIGSKK